MTGLALGSLPLLLFLLFPLAALLLFLSPADWWLHIRSESAVRALLVTLKTSLAATAICVAAGTPVALLLAGGRFRGKEWLDTLVDLPLTVPPVVAGVALLLAFGRNGLIGKHLSVFGLEIGFTSAAVVMAQVFVASPYFIKSARAGFETVDRNLVAAAATLGAGPWKTFRFVVLPLARPSLLAGVLLVWARALSEFGATMMFAGNFPGRTQTLTLAVMSAMESDLPTAVAVSTLVLILSIVTLVAAKWLAARWRPSVV